MIGETLAHYQVVSMLGAGGMGEVYKAQDTKLRREVALKLLPGNLAGDEERFARFQREAHLLASLHHPNIASIFGLEETEGRHFLVMELAEGEDLSQRIEKGPISEDEVLDIARQIASGLEEAHEKGIVHRDLKPANIKLGSDGKVKILDFGLARAFAGETASEENQQNSPTITAAATQGGVILGTAAYMSPEQARGKTVDRRADIWAFGVVLFEMLTGKRMFEGETISDTLAAVLRAEIQWSDLPGGTSHGMRRLLERCLERDPLRRLRDVGEARIFLEDGARDSSILSMSSSVVPEAGPAAGAQRLPGWLTWAVMALVAVVGVVFGWQVLGRSEQPRLLNTTLPHPPATVFHLLSGRPGPAALSPDGTMVAFCARDESGTVRVYLRRLDSPDATAVSGTEGAAYPFWSPDSRFIGFQADDKLKKVAVAGGPPVTLCTSTNMKGGTWNESGDILFAPDHRSGIHRVAATGGDPVQLTQIPEGGEENSHRHPRFLPDGKQFLFLARLSNPTEGEHRVYLGSLDGREPEVVTGSQVAAEYTAGHLLTAREGILLATPFDFRSGALGENGVPLVEDILIVSSGAACGNFSPTLDGMLVYQTSSGGAERSLQWAGPTGSQRGSLGDPGDMYRPRVSPDGKQAVVELTDPELDTTDLWLVDLETGLRSRFTFYPGDESNAVWTPDGREILYTAQKDSLNRIMVQPVEGTGSAAAIYEGTRPNALTCVSPDGKSAMLAEETPETDWDIFSLSLETGEKVPVVVEDEGQAGGVISPDGRWLAYLSQTTASIEIIVRPMSGGARRWQIDRAGGVYPFWSPDGSSLLYLEFSGEVTRVPVDGSGATFRAGAPQEFARVNPPNAGGIHVSLHPDGERLLHVGGESAADETGYLHLVTDWQRGLAK
jgi:serine/threonine protein kinase/Tol biopolymer transport system component